MYKKSASVATIAAKSLVIYFEKLPMFLKYLAAPVLLQILGGVILGIGMFMVATKAIGGGGAGAMMIGVLVLIAGIAVLVNAIWKYLIKMGGLILISKQIIENEPLKDTKYYTKAFESRSGYITYLLIAGFLIPLIPISLAFIGGFYAGYVGDNNLLALSIFLSIAFLVILCPFLIVTMQSFALSPNLTPWEAIVKGMKLSGGKYLQSWGLLILYSIIVTIISLLIAVFAMMVSTGAGLPKVTTDIISYIFSQFFIPYWAICFTWWYLRIEKEERSGR